MEANEIGDETMHFKTFSPNTANYAVHQTFMIWQYQQMPFTAHMQRRSDAKKGRKPWAQKGSGRARHGSTYSPLWGRTATNKAPHGLDNKRKKKILRHTHAGAISTVLQSKWKCTKVIAGLEEWSEARQKPLEELLGKAFPGRRRPTLLITRQGFGEMHRISCMLTPESYQSPLYLSGRHINNLQMRRPRDIDPECDALFQCLKARHVLISREAFYDLDAKYGRGVGKGWIFQRPRKILVQQLQKLADEYITDRDEEIQIARTLPRSIEEREYWAKDMREKIALQQAS